MPHDSKSAAMKAMKNAFRSRVDGIDIAGKYGCLVSCLVDGDSELTLISSGPGYGLGLAYAVSDARAQQIVPKFSRLAKIGEENRSTSVLPIISSSSAMASPEAISCVNESVC